MNTSRRDSFRPGAALAKASPPKVYTRLGVRPFIDLTATHTINGARHSFEIEMSGNRMTGTHSARVLEGQLSGVAAGGGVRFQSGMPYEGTRFSQSFTGPVSGGRMSGGCLPGEHTMARWTAAKT